MCFKTCWYSINSSLKRKNSTTPSNLKRGTVVKRLKIVLLHAIKRYDIIWDSILS